MDLYFGEFRKEKKRGKKFLAGGKGERGGETKKSRALAVFSECRGWNRWRMLARRRDGQGREKGGRKEKKEKKKKG